MWAVSWRQAGIWLSILVSGKTPVAACGKMKAAASRSVLGQLRAALLMAFDGQQAVQGARHRQNQPSCTRRTTRSKNQLRAGAARWLCAGERPERPAWLGSYVWVLLVSARCADLPLPASAAGQTGRGGRAKRVKRAPLAGGDDAEARWAASRRCCGFAQSCGRR